MIIICRKGRMQRFSTEIAGISLPFDFVHRADGERVLAASVPDDHPLCRKLAQTFGVHRNYEVIHGEVASTDPLSPVMLAGQVAPVLAAGVSPLGEVIQIAIRNGWSEADLEGSGRGDPGPRGGTSSRTGLTLAQMALTVPPEGWAEAADRYFPWEAPGWRTPGPGWTPPIATKMPPAPPVEPPPVEPPIAEPTAEGEGDDDEVDEVVDDDPEAIGKAAGTADPAVDAGYPAEHVGEARAIAHKLKAELGDAPLHHQKFNYVVRKAREEGGSELPNATSDQLEGLLAVHPS